MAEPSSSLSLGSQSFLSFKDGPNQSNFTQPTEAFSSGKHPDASPASMSARLPDHPASPDSTAAGSNSYRTGASASSNRVEPSHASPSRPNNRPSSSRGSRLGALQGRKLGGEQSTDSHAHSRDGSTSTNPTDSASSHDSGFLGRRNRVRAVPANGDIDETPDTGATEPLYPSFSELQSTNPQQYAERAASATGMLDFKSASSNIDTDRAGADAQRRPARPSSQSNLLDSFRSSSARNSTLGTPADGIAPSQSRGGRLGRLAYKKDDSISFIAQSRSASQQMLAESRNHDADGASHPSQSNGAQHRSSANAQGLGSPHEPSAHHDASAYRYPTDYNSGIEQSGAPGAEVGVASTYERQSAGSSSNSSRAPSVVGMHSAHYHNRFSRQYLPPQSPHEPPTSQAVRSSGTHGEPPAQAPSRAPLENGSSSPRGTLSDAAIVALGAMPGSSAGSLLNANGAPLSSKNILTIALQKAQNAVHLDSANNVPDAIRAYKQAVRLLEEVMDRIAPRHGKRSRPSREEERRRLKVIHDTYADRIRLLSMIYSPEETDQHDETNDTSFSSNPQQAAMKPDWLDRVRHDSQEDSASASVTPRPNANMLDPSMQQSPQTEESKSFLAITPVRSTFGGATPQAASPPTMQQAQAQSPGPVPWPSSPPRAGAPFSHSVDSSPRRRVKDHGRAGSRGSKGSRASVSLNIAVEQEVQEYRIPPKVISEEMPRISIDGLTNPARESVASSKREDTTNRDAAPQPREKRISEVQTQQHGRSGSDSSYQSNATGSRLKPNSRVLGLDDEARTPVTPYFDARAEVGGPDEAGSSVGSPAEAPARPQKNSLHSASKAGVEQPPPPPEKPPRMGLAQRARALSFKGPLLKQKASMPSLGDRKKDLSASAATSPMTPRTPSRRPGSAGMSASEAVPVQRTDSGSDHPTPWEEERTGSNMTVKASSNRPRASTASALVIASTNAGTISQRRKEKAAPGMAEGVEELGWEGEEATRPGSIAMSARQRSTSQPGGRRPSIPAQFVAANASASGGVLPSSLGSGISPPPVPNLARTLSALDLKRSADAARASAGGPDVSFSSNAADQSTSALAMPLPRPLLGEQGQESGPRASPSSAGRSSRFLITDIFPSGLPSLAAGRPSYAGTPLASSPLSSHGIGNPPHPLLKPFYITAQLRRSIISGAQLSPNLYLGPALWRQAGVKLLAVETKVRAVEVLLGGLEAVERAGEPLLMPLGSGAGLETSNAARFVRQLEEFEAMLGEVQVMLAKKLPFLESAGGNGASVSGGGSVGAKEGSKSKFGFSSRLTRGLDRMTGGAGQAKVLDSSSMTVYIDALSRLFTKLSLLSTHLEWVLVAEGTIAPASSSSGQPRTPIGMTAGAGGGGGAAMPSPTGIGIAHTDRNAYYALPPSVRISLLTKLNSASQFTAKSILVFVLHDLGILLDKWSKRGTPLFLD